MCYLCVTACLTVFGVGCSVGWTTPSLPKLKAGTHGLKLTSDEASWVASSHEIGHFLAPLPAAYLASHTGRRPSLVLASCFLTIGWILVTATESLWLLYTARFLFGFAMGIVFTIVPLYVAEVSSARYRGAFTTSFQAMLYLGHLVEFSIGPYVTYTVLSAISLGLSLLYFIFVVFMVESPHHLINTNKKEKAKYVISWLHKTTKIETIRKEMDHLESLMRDRASGLKHLLILFKKEYRLSILTVVLAAVANRFTGMSAIVAYAASTFPSSTGGLNSNQYTILFGLIVFIFTFVSAALLDTVGRRPIMLLSCGGCALSHLLTAYYYFHPSTATWIPFVSISLFACLYSLGIGPLLNTLQGELFPPEVKELASSITAIAHAASSFAVTKLFQVIRDDVNMYTNFLIFAASCFASFAFMYFLVPETKRKTLKEVQNMQVQNNMGAR